MPVKEDEFRKEIHLPKALKADLEVQAIRENYGDLKTMIQCKVIKSLEAWKNNGMLSDSVADHIDTED